MKLVQRVRRSLCEASKKENKSVLVPVRLLELKWGGAKKEEEEGSGGRVRVNRAAVAQWLGATAPRRFTEYYLHLPDLPERITQRVALHRCIVTRNICHTAGGHSPYPPPDQHRVCDSALTCTFMWIKLQTAIVNCIINAAHVTFPDIYYTQPVINPPISLTHHGQTGADPAKLVRIPPNWCGSRQTGADPANLETLPTQKGPCYVIEARGPEQEIT
ncbi:hypothetical protein Btru_075426 [Bulinus truncatus]|nr:hypothetical protein Btru_075426 [Bulinus truncatus]